MQETPETCFSAFLAKAKHALLRKLCVAILVMVLGVCEDLISPFEIILIT